MRSIFTPLLIFCALLFLSSCEPGNDKNVIAPAAVVEQNFTGCRIIRISSVATWDTTVRGHNEFIYDANNRIIESKEFYRGHYNGSKYYFYDTQGRLIRSEPYNYFYEYNAAGQLVKAGQFNDVKQVYHYNSSGLVDSSWSDHEMDGIYKPQFLHTYTYDSRNRLKITTGFEINAHGVINPVAVDSVAAGIYDTYKNPYALPSFTIFKIDPFLAPNNLLETDQQLFTYVYRPDSLVSEVTSAAKPNAGINGGGTIKYFYDCR